MNPERSVCLYFVYTDDGPLDELAAAAWQMELCTRLALAGKVRVAKEGLNACVSGTSVDIRAYCDAVASWPGLQGRAIDFKITPDTLDAASGASPFPLGLSVRVCDELVSLIPNEAERRALDLPRAPKEGIRHLAPMDFDSLLKNSPALPVVDVRNMYRLIFFFF